MGIRAFSEVGLVLELDGVVECRPYSQNDDAIVSVGALLKFKPGIVAEVLLEPHDERGVANLFFVRAKRCADDLVVAVAHTPHLVGKAGVVICGGISKRRNIAPLPFGFREALFELDIFVFIGELCEVLYENA